MTDHADDGQLAELDAGLPIAEALRRHVVGCPACAGRLGAIAELRRRLAGLPPEPMPAVIAARIEQALAAQATAAAAPAAAAPATTAAAAAAAAAAADHPEPAVAAQRPAQRPHQAQLPVPTQRRAGRRWAAHGLRLTPGLVAAAVVGLLLLGVGLGAIRSLGGAGPTSAVSGAGGVRAPAPGLPTATPSSGGPPILVASGRNYTPATLDADVRALLTTAQARRFTAAQPARPGGSGSPARPGGSGSPAGTAVLDTTKAPPALARLATAPGLTGCLAALTGRTDRAPLAVDYAAFGGRPAAVLVLPAAAGRVAVWVVGPACAPGDPAVLRYQQLPAG